MTAASRAPGPDRDGAAGLVALLLVQLFFGMFPILGKWAYAGGAFAPAAVATWRITVGAAALGTCAWCFARSRFWPARRDVPRLLLCAVLGVVLNQGLYLEGLARTQAIKTGVLICMIPVFTYLVAVAVRQERLSARRLAGIGVAAAGLLPLLLDGTGAAVFAEDAVGTALVTTNGLCYSFYLVLSRPLTARMPPLVVIAWVYLLSLPFVPWFAVRAELLPDVPPRAAWALALILIFPTVLAYLLNTFALARVAASTTAFFVFLQPFIIGIAGVLLLDETLKHGTILGGAALLAGGLLVMRRPRVAAAPASAGPGP